MTISSPCRGVCRLDESKQYCTGCKRTLEEIAEWRTFSDTDKKQVWTRLLSLSPLVKDKCCSACGTTFECGSGGQQGGCWCQDLPNLMPLTFDSGDCLCPECLANALARKVE
jgi:Predicted Fe-S protein